MGGRDREGEGKGGAGGSSASVSPPGSPARSPQVLLTDTSLVETIVFAERAGMEMGVDLEDWLRRQRYRHVFFLEPLPRYEGSAVRMESEAVARRLSEQIQDRYRSFGYAPVSVPALPLADRVRFLVSRIGSKD